MMKSSSPGASAGYREAGIVEKLLPSYGFIQCCERQARLFFHYSQFKGNIDHLKLGDAVEFEMTYDRRTGKPIASMVVKINSEAFRDESNAERVSGFITTEISDGREGRVAYENRGECFFLPFTKSDLEDPDQEFKQKDRVTFCLATDKSGNLRARRISLESPTPERYQGVVCTLKDSFGFIERADVVKEIFFHSSECKDFNNLNLGNDVEFSIQTRNSKEVAVNVDKLAPGTVVLEDISTETHKGTVVKTIERHNNHSIGRQHHASSNSGPSSSSPDPFPGRIAFTKKDGTEEHSSFSDKDVKGDYSLNVGDLVHFNLVTDRRDKLQHATNVMLADETFEKSTEQREQGYIAGLKESYGFIKCLNREGTRIFFRLAEIIDTDITPELNAEVEFTPVPDPSMPSRLQAIRIKYLPNYTIFKNVVARSSGDCNGDLKSGRTGYGYYGDGMRNGYGSAEMEPKQDISDNCEFPLIDFNSDMPSESSQSYSSKSPYLNKIAESRFASTHNSWSHILSQIPINMKSDLSNGSMNDNCSSSLTDYVSPSNECDTSSSNLQSLNPLAPYSSSSGVGSTTESEEASKNMAQYNNINSNNHHLHSSSSSHLNNTDACSKYDLTYTKNGYMNNAASSGGGNEYFTSDLYVYHAKNELKSVHRGFIAALKESFGFIESENHKNEVFFHYSTYEGDWNSLDLGDEVEYALTTKNNKPNAEWVRKIQLGSIPLETPEPEVLTGRVVRSVRCLNPDQDEYWGLVQVVEAATNEEDSAKAEEPTYEFSMTSLADIHDYVAQGDLVTFQLGYSEKLGCKRAINIKPVRTKYQATVDTIKGAFGFLNYAMDGKKLFFHMSEVRGDSCTLSPGDTVEFVIVQNQRSGKYSACSLVKLSINEPRPERLINRLKSLHVDENAGPKMIVIRQPRGPDGTKGFKVPRQSEPISIN
ncbi:cold shock domain-containing Unr isoform X2 [Brevipalpus obovatus]|uniref:cold shock domain-containing Unr isoform X2 n=1 Tax=Brevipalpus obovatus TaxID=246614 RepID=UPI003D9F7584